MTVVVVQKGWAGTSWWCRLSDHRWSDWGGEDIGRMCGLCWRIEAFRWRGVTWVEV